MSAAVVAGGGVEDEWLVPSTQPTRRNVELLLLVLAWLVGLAALILASYGVRDGITGEVWPIAGVSGAALLGVHVAVRRLAPYADPIMLPAAAALNLLGIAMIFRMDLFRADEAASAGDPPPSFSAMQQSIWLLIGAVACVGVLVLVHDHRNLRRYTYIWGLVSVILLLLPLVPGLGMEIRGARLWIQIGSFTFQPAELAKVTLTIFFASYLVQTREQLALIRHKVLGLGIPRGRDLGPILVVWLMAMAIMGLQTDLGTAVMFFGLFVGLLYVATGRRSWVVLGLILIAVGAVFAYRAFGHVQVRFEVWRHPFDYAADEGYQIVQAMYGFASGGMTGTGWGGGYPNLVPFADSDFIFAALGEELGLVGDFAVVVLFAILIERFLRTAVAGRDAFGTLVSAGFAIILGLQTFLVMGGVTKLIPHTGLTTPFMSAGGSSLLANWILLGIMLRISTGVRAPDPVLASPGEATTELIRR
jgi:cell division protein FtsW (lipid II flippase)